MTFTGRLPRDIRQIELLDFDGEARDVRRLRPDERGSVQMIVMSPSSPLYVGVRWEW